MKRHMIFTCALAAALCLTIAASFLAPLNAVPFTYYNYLTNREVTERNVIIWFWTPDTMWGAVHSNDFIGLKYSPHFYGYVSTSKGEFRYNQPQNIHFEFQPRFNVAPVNFPRTFPHLKEMAHRTIRDQDGRMMTVLRIRGEEGIFAYQYRLGGEPNDSLVMEIPTLDPRVIVVEGQLQLEGILVGGLTILATGDIYLLDDVRYFGSNNRTGAFDQDTTTSMLGVISERNIIIKDTYANGKENGISAEPNNWNRHSIILNGYYIALGSSFEIEHQNDDWDRYQGPTPDERGHIYLTGGVAQERRGFMHTSNHVGTGYGKTWHYDQRLRATFPPGFSDIEGGEIRERVVLGAGNHDIGHISAKTIIVQAGANLHFQLHSSMFILDTLLVEGILGSEVNMTTMEGPQEVSIMANGYVSVEHCNFGRDFDFRAEYDKTIIFRHCTFQSTPLLSGNITIENCTFESDDEHRWVGNVTVGYSTFHNAGIIITGENSHLTLINCTIVGGNGTGLSVLDRAEANVTNSIIAFSRNGIYCDNRSTISVRYSDVYGAVIDNYYGFDPGEGSFSRDPLLWDARRGDFQLTDSSPCIDSGDPESPPDPDGSRADIGALPWDHRLAIDDDNVEDDSPLRLRGGQGGDLVASPNPFNSSTVISIQSAEFAKSAVALKIYSLSGQVVASFTLTPAHPHTLTLNAPAGLYFISYEFGGKAWHLKILKLN